MQKFNLLDQLIFGYFNQDYDLINDGEESMEGIIKLYKNRFMDWMLKDLIDEVDDFITAYGDGVEDEFEKRYGHDFSPELWETTGLEFLMTVRRIASEK